MPIHFQKRGTFSTQLRPSNDAKYWRVTWDGLDILDAYSSTHPDEARRYLAQELELIKGYVENVYRGYAPESPTGEYWVDSQGRQHPLDWSAPHGHLQDSIQARRDLIGMTLQVRMAWWGYWTTVLHGPVEIKDLTHPIPIVLPSGEVLFRNRTVNPATSFGAGGRNATARMNWARDAYYRLRSERTQGYSNIFALVGNNVARRIALLDGKKVPQPEAYARRKVASTRSRSASASEAGKKASKDYFRRGRGRPGIGEDNTARAGRGRKGLSVKGRVRKKAPGLFKPVTSHELSRKSARSRSHDTVASRRDYLEKQTHERASKARPGYLKQREILLSHQRAGKDVSEHLKALKRDFKLRFGQELVID